ncbi:Endonuclease/Exonuclease/phosphatase_family protein [Hexamita inflata]|uniref:Endonuclease/Exonuclease/phosphatase family protein n=1 Tax=Hexamita inflata TaxID=28002 RepID=A0AA86Q1Q9_9EUKA|nr:Endonuclease/Exonuclease/phosphatase family protein [Hexamita inflata]
MNTASIRQLRVGEIMDNAGVDCIDKLFSGYKIIKSAYISRSPDDELIETEHFYVNQKTVIHKVIARQQSIRISYGDLVRLYFKSTALPESFQTRPFNEYQLILKKTFASQFLEDRHMLQLRLNPVEMLVTGSKKNVFVAGLRPLFNMRSLESNVLPFIDQKQFPFNVILNYKNSTVKIHTELANALNLKGINNGNYVQVAEKITQMAAIVKNELKTLCGFATFVDGASSVQKAAHSHFCVIAETEEQINKAVQECLTELKFVPAIFKEELTDAYYNPDMLYDDAEKKVLLFEEILNKDYKIEATTTQAGLRVMNWNLQCESNLMFDDAINIQNPFVNYLGYKLKQILKVVDAYAPDVITLCEANPIVHITKELGERGYQIEYTSLKNEFPYGACENGTESVLTAVLFKVEKLAFMSKRDLYMSRLAVDYPLLQRLGGKAPETDRFKFLQAFETYNTATIVNLQYEDKIVQVAAVYPNWSPLIEPVKYFQLKYVQAAMMESHAEFRIMAGDLNTRPSSCNYFMLGGVQLSPKECDEMTQPFIESMSRSKGRVIKFQEVCAEETIGYPLELKSAFAGEGEERKVVVGEKTLTAIEPFSTTTTCVFEDTLDYIFTDLKVLEKEEVYYDKVLANSQCVSDHVPIVAVLGK